MVEELRLTGYPLKRDFALTEKGPRVAEHLVEVERILVEKEKE